MLEVSGCLRNEKKKTSVGELERCMIQPSVCGEWEKKWKVWGCQQVSKKYKCLQKKRKRKMHRHDKNKSWYCARKKKKVVEKNKSEIKHLGLVENRSRPWIGGTSWSSVLLVLGALY